MLSAGHLGGGANQRCRWFPEIHFWTTKDAYLVVQKYYTVSIRGVLRLREEEELRRARSSSVFCPKAGPLLQAEKPRQVCHRKLRNQGCSFTRDLIGAVASRCFPHPTLSLASEQTLKDLKIYQGHQRGGEESGFS